MILEINPNLTKKRRLGCFCENFVDTSTLSLIRGIQVFMYSSLTLIFITYIKAVFVVSHKLLKKLCEAVKWVWRDISLLK